MGVRDLAYRMYERRLQASLSPEAIPRHVGVMCDGNRRWARSAGYRDVSSGHRKGADKIFELLDWCRETGVEVVTLWLLSTDNLTRSADENNNLEFPLVVGRDMRNVLPDVQSVTRFEDIARHNGQPLVRANGQVYKEEHALYAEPSFFSNFSFSSLQ